MVLVCKRWNYITEFHWSDKFKMDRLLGPKEAVNNKITSAEVIDILKRIGKTLKEILFDGDNTKDYICHFGNYYFLLEKCKDALEIMKILSEECRDLKTLKLKFFNSSVDKFKIWIKIIHNNKNLSTVDLDRNDNNFHKQILPCLPKTLECFVLNSLELESYNSTYDKVRLFTFSQSE